MNKIALSALFFAVFVSAQSFQEYNKLQTKAFEDEKKLFAVHQKLQDKEFENYKKAQKKVFKDYKKEIKAIWDTPKMTTKTQWVVYSKDKKTRTNVDFEKQTITVETIAPSIQEAKAKLQNALKKAITIDNKTFSETDPLEQKLAKIKKPSSIIDEKPKNEPIVSDMIFKTKPTKKTLQKYINTNIKNSDIEIVKQNNIQNSKVYTVEIHMPKDALIRKSKQFYEDVKKQALKQNLPISLVFAIMHSESSFNPRARSYVPAYGLMQIVPRTAGLDAYNYLYKKKKLVSGNYLYNSTNNITLGSAYLHILYYRYLRKIKNPKSRLYCAIASYNTGSGNVAWVFVKKHSMDEASQIINTMTSQEVYDKLIKNLKYDEAKKYLKKVYARVELYRKIYN